MVPLATHFLVEASQWVVPPQVLPHASVPLDSHFLVLTLQVVPLLQNPPQTSVLVPPPPPPDPHVPSLQNGASVSSLPPQPVMTLVSERARANVNFERLLVLNMVVISW
ncbi:MAG: hypothetical protein U0519_03055 [Candidatus Gracilibacteria bacterium]